MHGCSSSSSSSSFRCRRRLKAVWNHLKEQYDRLRLRLPLKSFCSSLLQSVQWWGGRRIHVRDSLCFLLSDGDVVAKQEGQLRCFQSFISHVCGTQGCVCYSGFLGASCDTICECRCAVRGPLEARSPQNRSVCLVRPLSIACNCSVPRRWVNRRPCHPSI